jgi:hypothetical protein
VRAELIYRAQHVAAAQLGISVEDALLIIERLARDTDEPVMFVVDQLLAGNVRFDQAAVS